MNRQGLVKKQIVDKNGKRTYVWVKQDKEKKLYKLSTSVESIVKEAFSENGAFKGMSTMEIFADKSGEFTEERRKLHSKIIDKAFEGKKPNKKGAQITSIMMGGAPSSGKSTLVESGLIGIHKDMVHIDADMVKAQIPEYQLMSAQNNPFGASFTHKESSKVTEAILSKATKEGYSALLDGTGNKSYEHLKSRVDVLKKAGHKVVAKYVTMDTALSLKLNQLRFKKTGRLVPNEFVKEVNKNIATVLLQAIENKLFDELTLYDTNIEGKPRKVLTFTNGKLDIHSQNLYKNFLRKRDE